MEFKKLTDNFGDTPNNYVIEHELTVKITLAEYRELVSDQATMKTQIAKAEENRYSRESENKQLKEENELLKAEIYEMSKTLEKIKEAEAEQEGQA